MTGVTYEIKEEEVTRFVRVSDSDSRASSLAIPEWVDKNMSAEDVYDLSWLGCEKEPRLQNPIGEVRAIDLFCGCGGLTLGVREAARALGYSFRCVFASDINANAIELYKRNFNPDIADQNPIEKHVDGELGAPKTKAERAFKKKVGRVDVVVAGPPCQGNSDLNNHTRRDDPKNLLYLRAVRCIEILRPKSIIIENVPGVLHEKHGVLQTAIEHLTKIGYSVDYGVIPMRKVGVPQMRKRMVLVGSLSKEVDLNKIIEDATIPERPISWCCEDLMGQYCSGDVFNSSANHSETNKKRIQYLFDHNLYELPNSERPDCHRLKPHKYTAVYGRMHWDIPSPTITGGFGSCGQGRFVHPLEQRTLTPHEAARVQTFPDFFDFHGIARRELQQVIGNAVPAKAGYVVGLPLLRAQIDTLK